MRRCLMFVAIGLPLSATASAQEPKNEKQIVLINESAIKRMEAKKGDRLPVLVSADLSFPCQLDPKKTKVLQGKEKPASNVYYLNRLGDDPKVREDYCLALESFPIKATLRDITKKGFVEIVYKRGKGMFGDKFYICEVTVEMPKK